MFMFGRKQSDPKGSVQVSRSPRRSPSALDFVPSPEAIQLERQLNQLWKELENTYKKHGLDVAKASHEMGRIIHGVRFMWHLIWYGNQLDKGRMGSDYDIDWEEHLIVRRRK